MASIQHLKSGSWRAQVRRKGQSASRTFRLQGDARRWATEVEHRIDQGLTIDAPSPGRSLTLAQLIDLHIDDMCSVAKPPRRSKAYCLELLKRKLGQVRIAHLTRDIIVAFAKDRAKCGAGPVTVSMDIGYLKSILSHAAAVHGLPVSTEPVDQARVALKRLGLVGKSRERDRRPAPEELAALLNYLDEHPRLKIPVGRIVRFAIATGMRQDEISRLTWADVNVAARTATIRNRKHPRDTSVNDQTIALVNDAGWDPIGLLQEQAQFTGSVGRVFPYNGRSVGTAFRRACRTLNIEDLHFHDLRHETASRLFEAGYQIPEVALVTGHKDWKMLRRYTNLKPEVLAGRVARAHRLSDDNSPALLRRTTDAALEPFSAAFVERSISDASVSSGPFAEHDSNNSAYDINELRLVAHILRRLL